MTAEMKIHTYRVWMKDGYASLVNAADPDDAKQQAAEQARKSCEGAAMSPAERRKALAVDYFEKLS